MALTKEEKEVIKESIEAHRRMIKYHRARILDLSRKMIDETEHEIQSLGLELKNESGR